MTSFTSLLATKKSFTKNLDKLFNSEEGPVLLEVFTNAEEDTQALKDYYQAF